MVRTTPKAASIGPIAAGERAGHEPGLDLICTKVAVDFQGISHRQRG